MIMRRLLSVLGLAVLGTFAAPAAAQNCIGGVSEGQIVLPGGGLAGTVNGALIIGHTGPTVFLFHGTLSELPPTSLGERRGVIDGLLFDGSNVPRYQVRGRWFASGFGQGFFRCIVFELGPNGNRVGRIGGQFPPPPGPLAFSPYKGNWVICP